MNFEEYYFDSVSGENLDILFEHGFRHFGIHFYRYSHGFLNEAQVTVLPLRIQLSNFILSKSQKKILRKNDKFKFIIRDCFINTEKLDLFEKHKMRFKDNIPESIYNFIYPTNPHCVPCEMKEISVYDSERLIAVSFLDIGKISTSSIYGMFHPEYSEFSLGIYTMLLEIQFSLEHNKKLYYPGYAYREPSFYDYKKKFIGLESFYWESYSWLPFQRLET